ncbi:transcriptional regulator, TetR family protein [Fimbriimonas ginsengisoli Gsoil 348]|uniref:Transcriptional regulator, TetR family protein n=2 Tax=Fimbriimonas ginsengisoli TaxID=1005039 RepID=A0A068NYZ5_FIMGI|nr:transcriptional regulator, TetR family protein [Fimbriimonas ginsengisoli Gsoil 348]
MILQSSLKVFAQKGLEGATSRELAAAAGVSEGLLYKHFPTKEILYSELALALVTNKDALFARLMAEPPSAASFIGAFHVLAKTILLGPPGRVKDDSIDRLIGQSLLGDGSFAASFLESVFGPICPYLTECLQVAWASGELQTEKAPSELHTLFVHHFFGMIALFSLPQRRFFPVSGPEELFREAFLFACRGVGFTDLTVRRYAP